MTAIDGSTGGAERLERIERLLDECLRRRAAGEVLRDEAVGVHPSARYPGFPI